MNQKKPILFVSLAALAIICVVIALFLRGNRQSEHEAIVLPETAAPVQTAEPEPVKEAPALAEIREDNVQKILRSLSRPSSYHQELKIVRAVDGKEYGETVYQWVSGKLLHADLISESGIKSVLTDGKTLYLWYDDDNIVSQFELDDSVTMDDLIGIPTYERILALDESCIEKAEFVTEEQMDNMNCVCVRAKENGAVKEYWVSLDSGLLCMEKETEKDIPTYFVQQSSLEILADGDVVFSDIFILPDGSEPFSEE